MTLQFRGGEQSIGLDHRLFAMYPPGFDGVGKGDPRSAKSKRTRGCLCRSA